MIMDSEQRTEIRRATRELVTHSLGENYEALHEGTRRLAADPDTAEQAVAALVLAIDFAISRTAEVGQLDAGQIWQAFALNLAAVDHIG
ncbi:hypothetical protein AB0G04_02550 [Actinoplanes sp. NPDC023801]|uniref:hypothetical protein n=1 Tax=Actinoplanes sp. NPDC023801 TaxID=3154595 RepID=UPI0033E601E5